MLLTARLLTGVCSVNTFNYTSSYEATEGDAYYLYFQLIDASLDRPEERFFPSGRRYIPDAGATLSVVLNSIDNDKKYTKTASQPFSGDASIWRIQVLSTDQVLGSVNMILSLTQSGVVTHGLVKNALSVYQTSG